jgi:hypothetical protein
VNSGGLVDLVGGLVELLVFMNPFDSVTCVGPVGVAVDSDTDVVGVSVRMMLDDFTTVPIVECLV